MPSNLDRYKKDLELLVSKGGDLFNAMQAGGPFKPGFGLSGGGSTAGTEFSCRTFAFRVLYSDSIPATQFPVKPPNPPNSP
jgi:hypothetical protein